MTGPLKIKLCRERLQGFLDVIRNHGIKPDDRLVYEGDFHFNSGIDAVPEFFGQQQFMYGNLGTE